MITLDDFGQKLGVGGVFGSVWAPKELVNSVYTLL